MALVQDNAEDRIASIQHKLNLECEARQHAEQQHATAVKALFAERQAHQAAQAQPAVLNSEVLHWANAE